MNLEQFAQIGIYIHAALGGIALLMGTLILFLKKGTKRHKQLGRIFFNAMLVSCVLSLVISMLPEHHNPFLFSIGVFSIYLIVTGRRAIKYRKLSAQGLLYDKVLSWAMVITGFAMIVGPLLRSGSINIVLLVFGLIGLLFSGRDLLYYRDLKKLKQLWLRLHIGKIMGGYIAAVTAFLVVNEVIPGIWVWIVPSILGSVYIRYSLRKFPLKHKAAAFLLIGTCTLNAGFSQVYVEKQTRHRFAQLNLGLDYQTHSQGSSAFINRFGGIETFDLPQNHIPRFVIGGTHFWGHADFYIAIPLSYPEKESSNQVSAFGSSIETVFKYYPWRITATKVRPYVGLSMSPYYFIQDNQLLDFGAGPSLRHTSVPLLGGLTYNTGNHLVELGLTWNYHNNQTYYLDRTQTSEIRTPPLYFNLSYRHMIETTQGAEKDWESGKTEEITELLDSRGKLNSWFVGVGMSSAFWLGKSEYNEENRPFMEPYGISVFPDFSVGYYLNRSDINFSLNYRAYSHGVETYGVDQFLKRRSFGFEISKFVWDYNGFVPFIGPIISSERLRFEESFENQSTQEVTADKWSWGITFGWDIRPNRLQSWILRTNLRWYPDLNLGLENGQAVNFSNLEFNFIQLIVYPDRFF
ncbi:MAG: hypothetical protein AAF694_09910 [Bacteroidota bacterium]